MTEPAPFPQQFAQQFAAQFPPPFPPQRPPMNTLAVLSVVLLAVCAPASIVLGLLGRRQTAQRGERGHAMATVGLVAGSVCTLFGVALTVLVLASGAVSVQTYAGPFEPGATVASGIVATSGGRVQDVTCPQDLPGTVGATISCTGTIDGRPGTLRVTTTEVQGQDVGFGWKQVS